MTYLEMCNDAYQKVGKDGEIASTTTATGFEAVVCDFVKDAWHDIQRERKEFDFFYYSTSLETLSGDTDEPTLPTPFHQVIVFCAVRELAAYLGEPVLEQQYSRRYNNAMGQLMRSHVPARRVYPRPIC